MAGKQTASPVDDARAAALLRMDTDSESDAGGDAVGGGDAPQVQQEQGGGVDAATADRLVILRDHISAYPQSYEAHHEYVELLRKAAGAAHDDEEAGQLWVLLSGARESFAKEFPLSEALWLEWVEDCEKRGEERAIGSLWERAVGDYPTPALWKRRMEHERKQGRSAAEVRAIAEAAVRSCGADVANGAVLWEEFADFEKEALGRLEGDADREDQRERVRGIYKRALGLPMVGLKCLHQGFLAFEGLGEESPSSPLSQTLEVSLDELESRETYEDGLSKSDNSQDATLEVFQKYLKYENKYGDPGRVVSLFQRLVCRFPCHDPCWDAFGKYVENQMQDKEFARETYLRAVRNCPWSPQLWARALATSEGPECRPSQEELLNTSLSNALLVQSLTQQSALDLLLVRADALRRAARMEELRQFFRFAWDKLCTLFPDYRDDTFQLARYWARMESPEVATKMWQEMAGRYGSTCPVWLAWVDFELHHGGPASVKAARAIFQKAHSKCSEIAAKWRAFEGEYGSAESAAQAYRKTSLINFSLMAAEAPRQVEAEVPKPTKRKKPATKKPAKKPAKKRAKVDAAAAAEVLPEKGDSEVCTLFVKNLPFDMEQQSLTDLLGGEEAVKECRIVMGWGGKSKGFAYVDCTSEAALQKALEKNGTEVSGRKLFVARSKPPSKVKAPQRRPPNSSGMLVPRHVKYTRRSRVANK